MSFKLETGLGCFEGATLADCQKAFRAAEREVKKRQAVEVQNQREARAAAYKNGYLVLSGNGPSYTFYAPNQKYSPVQVSRGESSVFPVRLTFNGQASTDQYSSIQYLGCLETPSGFAAAIFLRDGDGPIQALAVGTCADQVELLQLPGVTIEQFQAEPVEV